MSKFYHTIGYKDNAGRMHYKLLYRIESFLYSIRQLIAFIIFPEWRKRFEDERYNIDYIQRLILNNRRDAQGKEKALHRQQKENRKLQQLIRELEDKANKQP
jgi:hypothetical protein